MTDSNTDSVVLERTLDAPAALVWAMWTDPAHFGAWYGPQGAKIPRADMDVRVGGSRLICMEMETPNGPMQMWFTGEYLEVTEPRRLVYTEAMCDENGTILTPEQMGMPGDHPENTEVIVELEDLGDKTRLVLTHVGVPADSPGAMGWNMALDKMVAHLDAQ